MQSIQLTIGGESKKFDSPLNVTRLVETLGLAGKRFAVELNGEIVPRSRFAEQFLKEGDTLEIVTAVGGG